MNKQNVFIFSIVAILVLGGALIFSMNDSATFKPPESLTGNAVHNSFTGFSDPGARVTISLKNLTFNNDSQIINITITVTDYAIYSKAHISFDSQPWVEFNLTPQGSINKDGWFMSKANAVVSISKDSLRLNSNRTNTSENYIVVYTCSKTKGAWDCHNGWQIINFEAEFRSESAANNTNSSINTSSNTSTNSSAQTNTTNSTTNNTSNNSSNNSSNASNSTNISSSTTPLAGATFTTLWTGLDWVTLNSDTYIRQYGGSQGGALITIGSTDYLRSPGTQSVKYYHDGVANRVELHSKMNYLGVKEGTTVYMGWSDYYTIMPIHNYTLMQWRDQDKRSNSSSGYTGCPIIQFEMVYRYSGHYNSTNGTTIKGIVVKVKEGKATGGRGTIVENIQTNQWYDYVVAIKYSKGSDGYFTVWAGPSGTIDYTDQPVYSYTGPTMYSLSDLNTSTAPCSYDGGMEDHFNSPQLRMGGAYQWGTKAVFESYKGPLRININETGETAFAKVMPR